MSMKNSSSRVSCLQQVHRSAVTLGMMILAVSLATGCQTSRCSKCSHRHRHPTPFEEKPYEETYEEEFLEFGVEEDFGFETLVASQGDQKSGAIATKLDAFFVTDGPGDQLAKSPAAERQPVPPAEVPPIPKAPAEIVWTKRGMPADTAPARLNVSGSEVRTVSGSERDTQLEEPRPAPAVEFVSPPKKLELKGENDRVSLARHDDYLIADYVFPDDVNKSRNPRATKTRQIQLTSFEEPEDDGWRAPRIRR